MGIIRLFLYKKRRILLNFLFDQKKGLPKLGGGERRRSGSKESESANASLNLGGEQVQPSREREIQNPSEIKDLA